MCGSDGPQPSRSAVGQFRGAERAVSDVVGSTILVGITVLLTAVFGTFALALVARSLFFVVGV